MKIFLYFAIIYDFLEIWNNIYNFAHILYYIHAS